MLSDQSAKIKNIFIQLHGYVFYHGPSDARHADKRFIGREGILAKLEAILTNSETKSGAYLVTGYRGMGKSSFVNQVLNRVSHNQLNVRNASSHFRIFFPLFFLSMLGGNTSTPNADIANNVIIWILPSALFCFALAYLLRTDCTTTNIPGGENKSRIDTIEKNIFWVWLILMIVGMGFALWRVTFDSILTVLRVLSWMALGSGFYYLTYIGIFLFSTQKRKIVQLLRRTFFMEMDVVIKKNARILAQDFYLLSLIQVLSALVIKILGATGYNPRFACKFGVHLLFYLVIVSVNSYHHYWLTCKLIKERDRTRKDEPGLEGGRTNAEAGNDKHYWRDKKTRLNDYCMGLFRRVRNYVDYSNIVHIRINLGHDNVREIDILRLVASEMLTRYTRKVKTLSFPELSWNGARFILVLLLLTLLYGYKPIYEINQSIKLESSFIRLCPSQAYSYYDRADSISASLVEDLSRQGRLFNVRKYLSSLEGCSSNVAVVGRLRELLDISDTPGPYQQFRLACIHADCIIVVLYQKLLDGIPFPSRSFVESALNKMNTYVSLPVNPDYCVFPKRLDYLFWIYFWILWFLARFVSRWSPLGIVTHSGIIRRLKHLNDIITANVTMEAGTGISGASTAGLGWKWNKIRAIPRADDKEIEKQLVEILDDISRVPRFTRRPEFIVIFDEVDKIEPHKNITIFEEEEERNITDDIGGHYPRQKKIFHLLSNLKHFLTTAKAKFIFIAGREMYDASLADVSDRSFFVGSIFNEVIYVDSFLKDPTDGMRSDITSMTEEYVCQFLIPEEYAHREPSLMGYYRYLAEIGLPGPENKRQRLKVLYTLQNFIVYLTYRSNGAPKKITQYFEKFVSTIELERLAAADVNLRVGTDSRALYLEFGFVDQYTFGMASHLITPFFLSINKSIKDYGDKLLVSSSFLVDHLYKFHRVGFSWRNLELTPEIVDVNKAPHLRELIGQIVRFLQQSHIQLIDSGVYNFKFNRKISEEITLLSKLNELESAAFNFALDESLALKKHYRRQLKDLEKSYEPHIRSGHSPEFIRAISFVHMILGDLHYYDDENDNAIMEYMQAIQLFGEGSFENLPFELYVLMVRNTLKLGIAFEKRKTFETAYMVYGKLCTRILKLKLSTPKGATDEDRYRLIDGIQQYLEDWGNFSTAKEYLHFRYAVIENLRLFYQPFLAKFQLAEKSTMVGITGHDLKLLNKEIELLFEGIKEKPGSIVTADFATRLGNILYFKNGLVPSGRSEGTGENGTVEARYCQTPDARCGQNTRIDSMLASGAKTPCSACRSYFDALENITVNILEIVKTREPNVTVVRHEHLIKLISYLDRANAGASPKFAEPVMRVTAKNLSDIGDTFVSCASPDEILSSTFLNDFLSVMGTESYEQKAKMVKSLLGARQDISKIEESIIYYYLSALFYRRSGDYKEYAFQLTKILYLIREYYSLHKFRTKEARHLLNQIEQQIAKRAIRALYRTYESAHRLEIHQYSRILEMGSLNEDCGDILPPYDPDTRSSVLTHQSISADVREIAVLFNELNLLFHSSGGFLNTGFHHEGHVHTYSTINSMFNRILELKHQAHFNYHVAKTVGMIHNDGPARSDELQVTSLNVGRFKELLRLPMQENIKGLDAAEFLVTDSIFCLVETIKSCKLFGFSYNANHSFLASTHDRLSDWSRWYHELVRLGGVHGLSRAEDLLEQKIGKDNISVVNEEYQAELAIRHYRLALDTHREGRAYKEMIEDMSYLNDDFNDNLYHFAAGLERYRINSGKIVERIKVLRRSVQSSKLYDVPNYAPWKTAGLAGRALCTHIP